VRRCDITVDDVEPASYDLVHSRFLLMHLDDPADALRRMAAALRPGGWFVAEETSSLEDAGLVEIGNQSAMRGSRASSTAVTRSRACG
jgi:SAM-dependent methyltransferase